MDELLTITDIALLEKKFQECIKVESQINMDIIRHVAILLGIPEDQVISRKDVIQSVNEAANTDQQNSTTKVEIIEKARVSTGLILRNKFETLTAVNQHGNLVQPDYFSKRCLVRGGKFSGPQKLDPSESIEYISLGKIVANFIAAPMLTSGEYSEVQFGLEQTAVGSMRMEQQIFDGSWIVGLQATKVYLETSKNFYEKTLLEVKEGVIKLYSLVAILKEGVSLLENNVDLPIFFWDESYTSLEAEHLTKNFFKSSKDQKKHIDKFAAKIILDDFLREYLNLNEKENN